MEKYEKLKKIIELFKNIGKSIAKLFKNIIKGLKEMFLRINKLRAKQSLASINKKSCQLKLDMRLPSQVMSSKPRVQLPKIHY